MTSFETILPAENSPKIPRFTQTDSEIYVAEIRNLRHRLKKYLALVPVELGHPKPVSYANPAASCRP